MLKLQPKTLFVGQNQIYLPYCHSTNDVASELGQKASFKSGTLVITDFQTAGRGQRGTTWESEQGKNLTMSLLLDTSFIALHQQFDLSVCTALAVRSAISVLGLNAVVKWPNDIYIANKKVAGILIENNLRENKLNYSVIGIGININQDQFENPRATSLKVEGLLVSREVLVEKICEQFEHYFQKLKAGESLKEQYHECLLGMNEWREFESDNKMFKGKITGVEESGELVIESEISKKKFNIKEISFCF